MKGIAKPINSIQLKRGKHAGACLWI